MQHPHPEEVSDGFLTPASLKTRRRQEIRTERRRHPPFPFACSLVSFGNSPSAPLRLCARPSSFRAADGTGSSRAEALGRRGRETRHHRLLRGLAALPLLSVRGGTGRKKPRSLEAAKGRNGCGCEGNGVASIHYTFQTFDSRASRCIFGKCILFRRDPIDSCWSAS